LSWIELIPILLHLSWFSFSSLELSWIDSHSASVELILIPFTWSGMSLGRLFPPKRRRPIKQSNFIQPGEDFSMIWNLRIVDMHILVILAAQIHNMLMASGISQEPKRKSRSKLSCTIGDQFCTWLQTITPHSLASAPSYPSICLSTWLSVPNCGHISPNFRAYGCLLLIILRF
jgi:hypothetical protein